MIKSLAASCDGPQCPSTTFDYMADKWVRITGEIVEYSGRIQSGPETGTATTSMFVPHHGERHFCSWVCLHKLGKGYSNRNRGKANAED